MRTEISKKSWKGRIWNVSIVVALLTSVVVFGVMLQLEKNELSRYEKGLVYVATREIPKGQLITENNYSEYMEQRLLDKSFIPDTALITAEQICDMAAVGKIEKGIMLTTGMFEAMNTIIENMREPVLAGFKAEDMYQVVGGTLRAGDRIHIYSIDESEQWVWKNVYVQQVFDGSGTRISGEDTESVAQRVNVYLEGADVEKFYACLKVGTLRVVKVCV